MAIMAAGLLVVLIAGGIDISFAAIAAVTQYLVATILVQLRWPMVGGRLLPLSAVFGAPARSGQRSPDSLPPGSISHCHHLDDDLLFCDPDVLDGRSVDLRPARLVYGDDRALGNSVSGVVAAIVLIFTAILLNRLAIGRQIYGLGGNGGPNRMGCNLVGLQCLCLRLTRE